MGIGVTANVCGNKIFFSEFLLLFVNHGNQFTHLL